MSGYQIKETSTGGSFVSFLTKKAYPYERTWDHADKRRAEAQMKADDRAFMEAANARAARPVEPDNRSTLDRIREDGVTTKTKESNTERAYVAEISRLEKQLQFAQLPEDQSRIKRRLAMYKEGLSKHVEKIAVQEEETARRTAPAYLKCLADAELEAELLLARPDVPQEFCDITTANLAALAESTDVAAYREASKALTARYQELRRGQIAELKARKAELEAEIERTKKDEPAESSEVA